MMIIVVSGSILLLIALLSVRAVVRYTLTPARIDDSELPSISLLIPARNETHAITRALTSATALDYPKLEIIVLDDQSQDNTPEKIRSFAQDGVRFIAGEPLPEHWTGKNWACQQLAEAASGQYLLFCDTDVQLTSHGLNRLIRYVHSRKLAGASVQAKLKPANRLCAAVTPVLIWSTQLPGSRHPKIHPSYGGLQLFRTEAWRQHGGYNRHKNDMLAEFFLAKNFRRIGGFAFIRNNPGLGFIVLKTRSELDSARLRYLRHLSTTSMTLTILHILLLVVPWVILILQPWLYPLFMAAVAIAYLHQAQDWFIIAFLWPIIAVYEAILFLRSLFITDSMQTEWQHHQL